MGKRIWIDPGHGGRDPGAMGPGGRMEKADNLRFALLLRDLFEARGCQVVMTRTVDCFVDLTARTRLERESGCDLAISCHRNGGPETATGVEVWLHSRTEPGYLAWAAEVVEGIRRAGMAVRSGKIPQRVQDGVFRGYLSSPDANYAVNAQTNAPSMLLELGFVSNPQDNQVFDAKLAELAQAVADASCAHLGMEPEENPTPLEEKHRSLLTELKNLLERYR